MAPLLESVPEGREQGCWWQGVGVGGEERG